MSDYTFSPTLIPSGSFAATNNYQILPLKLPEPETKISTQVTFNPGLLERYRGGDKKTPAAAVSKDLIRGLQIADRVVTEVALEDYARTMRRLAADFAAAPSNCNLAPLRGARLRALLVNIMTDWRITFDYFDYHQGCTRVRNSEPRLRQEVTEILVRRDPQIETYRLAVVDVVEGGYGIPALVDLLEAIKNSEARFQNQHWIVDLRLLHEKDLTSRLRELLQRSTRHFDVRTAFYRVTDTIVEDFDDVLGFALVSADGVSFLKPCTKGGRFLYKGREGIAVVESADLNLTIQDYAAQKITDDLISDPSVRQIRDKWRDYTEKG